MTDVAPETKKTVIRDVAADYGVAEATLEDAWTKAPEQPAAASETEAVKAWFVRHLTRLGIITSSTGDRVEDDEPEWFEAVTAEEHAVDDDVDDKLARLIENEIKAAGGSLLDKEEAEPISQDVFARAERRVMDELMREARSSAEAFKDAPLIGGAVDADALLGDDDDEDPLPAGQFGLFRGRRARRFKGAVRKWRTGMGATAFVQWAQQNATRTDIPWADKEDKARGAGRRLGKALAEDIAAADRAGSKPPPQESAQAQQIRAKTVIRLLIKVLASAGAITDASWSEALAALNRLSTRMDNFSSALRPASMTTDAHLIRRGKAAASLALMRDTLLVVAQSAVPAPGEMHVPGFGDRPASIDARIDRLGKRVRTALGRDDTSAGMLVLLCESAIRIYVEHSLMRPYAALFVGTVKIAVEDILGPYAGAEEEPAAVETTDANVLARVSEDARTMADTLIRRVTDLIRGDPSARKKAGDRVAVLVPGDAQCRIKVQAQLADPDKSLRYIRGAVLARHPNPSLDKAGHLLSMSGVPFHLKPVTAGTMRAHPDDTGAVVQLQQMQHAEQKDGAWATPQPHPTRRAMTCLTSATRVVTLDDNEDTFIVQPLYYWPKRA